MATPQQDPYQQFLASIGAARLDSAGRPVGSTGGAVAINQDQEQQLRSFQQPRGYASGGQVVQGANPLDFLNKTFGTNIGAPKQGIAMQQATDSLAPTVQMGQAFQDLGEQNQAAVIAQRIKDAGLNLTPGLPGFNQQKQAAEGIYRQVMSQNQAQQGNAFMRPGNAYMGGGPAPTGADVLAAGGQPVTGYGGTQISGQAGPNGNNQFFLKQGPQPPAGISSRPAPVQQPAQVQQGPDPLRQAQETYKAATDGIGQNDRYRRTSPMSTKDGQYLGEGVFDTRTGKAGLMGADGKVGDLPPGAEPITATGLQKSIPDQKAFRNLKGELTDAEISLKNMDRYIKSVGDAGQGVQRLADKFSAGMKTLVGQGLNPQEIATKMAEGQLQGLLGANRTNVVGGGVMTEQDALRIIQRLGGDFNSLSNPEIVRQAIGQVYSDRYKQYEDSFNFYNAAVGDYYGSRGFKPAERVEFSESFTESEQPVAATESAKPAVGAGLSPEKQKRLTELRAKAAAKNKGAK
jgi:hypothetical protein